MDFAWFTDLSEEAQTAIVFVGVIVISIAVGYIAKSIFLTRISLYARTNNFEFDDIISKVIRKIGIWLYIAIGLLISVQLREVDESIYIGSIAFSTLVIGYYIIMVLDFSLQQGLIRTLKKDNTDEYDEKDDQTVIRFISIIAKFLMWALLFIIILQNAGYNASTLLGGLGVIGLAVAFAVQNILSDIFSFLSIYFDKPFKAGDFITVGDDAGFIKKIGIKSTRIETLQGEELVVSNQELTSTRINNFKRMAHRRIEFNLGVEYGTSNENLRKINDILEDIFNELEIARLDRSHFKAFGDFSLIFEVVYYVDSPDYNTYMDIQQKINLEIKQRFENEGIEMAFPTSVVINRG